MPSLLSHPALAPHDGRSGSESHQNSESYYTNKEIEILDDVVTTAQESLNLLPERDRLPTNALFKAYDAVLPRYGIDPENDQHISKLVFRVGGERGDGTLSDKFRAVLSRMGIEVEYDTVPVSVQATSDDSHGASSRSPSVESGASRAHRRNLDAGTGDFSRAIVEEITGPRLRSLSLSEGAGDRLERINPRLKSRRASPPDLDHKHVQRRDSFPRRISPSTGGDTEQSQRSPRSYIGSDPHRGASDTTVPTVDDVGSLDDHLENHTRELDERAVRFQEYRIASGAQNLFQQWRRLAAAWERLEEQVSSRHRGDKAEDILRMWHVLAGQRAREARQKAEDDARKENYYRRCERVAARARDIYLITMTFAQWQEHACEKAERTAVARRHILRLRHFDSWKETALNEERIIRSFMQGIYLPRWVKYHETLKDDDARAAATYGQNLVAKTFQDWFFLHVKQTATRQRSQRLMETAFRQWLGKAEVVDRIGRLSATQHKQSVLTKSLVHWRTAAGRWMGLDKQSKAQVQHVTASQSFRCWRSLTLRQTTMEQACRSRRLGATFEAWNLEAKLRAFQEQSDYRLMSETFHEWLCLQKITAFQLARDRASVERIFGDLLRRSQHLEDMGQGRRIRSAASRVSNPSTAARFGLWLCLANHMCAQEWGVDGRRAEGETIQHLNAWDEAATDNAEMERWARRGEFYLMVDKDFGLWKDWAKAEKERKLRIAYAQAKHGAKTRQILRCWREWRCQSDLAGEMMTRADDVCRNCDRSLGEAAMNLWLLDAGRGSGLEQRSRYVAAESLLSLWGGAAADCANADDEAWGIWAERMADSCWKRWNIAFQWVEGQEYNASKAEGRLRKKSLHEAFLWWERSACLDTARAGRSGRTGDTGLGSGLVENRENLSRSEAAWTAERRFLAKPRAWTRSNLLDYNVQDAGRAGDDQAGDADSNLGTMDTPTRWTGLAGPVTGLPSTTPSVPLPTPYERELRARYGTTDPTSMVGSWHGLSAGRGQLGQQWRGEGGNGRNG